VLTNVRGAPRGQARILAIRIYDVLLHTHTLSATVVSNGVEVCSLGQKRGQLSQNRDDYNQLEILIEVAVADHGNDNLSPILRMASHRFHGRNGRSWLLSHS
jgi:hypothetical protein